MEEAYAKTTGDGQYHAPARNLYYVVREMIQQYTDKELTYEWFTQPGFLPTYRRTVNPLPLIYYDPRGELHEPHTGTTVPLGTTLEASFRCCVQVGEVGALLSHMLSRGTPQGRRLSKHRLRLRLDGRGLLHGGCEVHRAPSEQQHTCRPLLVLADRSLSPSAPPYLLAMATEIRNVTTRTTPRMAPKLRATPRPVVSGVGH
jgi:hypothetical protein